MEFKEEKEERQEKTDNVKADIPNTMFKSNFSLTLTCFTAVFLPVKILSAPPPK